MATADEVLAAIQAIARDELELVRAISSNDRLAEDLRLDSMAAIVLAVGLEDRFRVKLSEADLPALSTVGDLAAHVATKTHEEPS